MIASGLPDLDPSGDDVHRAKDVAVAPDGTVYFNVGSSSNANPDDRTFSPPRAVIMAVRPDGSDLRVVEEGVRNGEGLAVAPGGIVWTAVNERDNIPDAAGQVVQSFVNEHPPDEVVPVTAGRDLGWPYCDPDQDADHGSLADVPLVPDPVTNPGGRTMNCAALAPVEVGLPAHSAPLGMSFLEGTAVPAPWSGGAVLAVHGSWDRQPPRAPAILWLAWNGAKDTLMPAITLVSGFQNADGSRWGRPVDVVPGPGGALYVSDDMASATTAWRQARFHNWLWYFCYPAEGSAAVRRISARACSAAWLSGWSAASKSPSRTPSVRSMAWMTSARVAGRSVPGSARRSAASWCWALAR